MIESTQAASVTVEVFIGLCIPSGLSDEVHLTAVKRSHERLHKSPQATQCLISDTGDRHVSLFLYNPCRQTYVRDAAV